MVHISFHEDTYVIFQDSSVTPKFWYLCIVIPLASQLPLHEITFLPSFSMPSLLWRLAVECSFHVLHLAWGPSMTLSGKSGSAIVMVMLVRSVYSILVQNPLWPSAYLYVLLEFSALLLFLVLKNILMAGRTFWSFHLSKRLFDEMIVPTVIPFVVTNNELVNESFRRADYCLRLLIVCVLECLNWPLVPISQFERAWTQEGRVYSECATSYKIFSQVILS